MARRSSLFASMLAASFALGMAATPAAAITISATETIFDTLPFDIQNRNLTRDRSDSTGFSATETSDAAIIADNNVDSDFGVVNLNDVTFRHDLTWLNPAATTYLVASLTIESFGTLGGDDNVYTETLNLGSLNSGVFTTTVFGSSNPVVLNLLFADGFLDILVDKNQGAGFPGNLNLSSIYSSSLTVRYESDAVPEPTAVALLGLGMLGLLVARKRAA